MRETKLILLLRTFDTSEMKGFDKFVKSPYFNTNKTIIQLWEHIKKYAPDFTAVQLSQEKSFKKLFPKTPFDEKRLRQLRSRLFKLVEQFLVIEQINEDQYQYDKQLATVYYKRALKEEFEKKQRALVQNFAADGMLEVTDLQQKLELQHQLYFNEFKVKGDKHPAELAECTQLLEEYYTRQKLLYTIEWLSISKRYSHNIPDIILNYCEYLKKRSSQKTSIIIEILEQAVILFLSEGKQADDIFDKVKHQFEANYKNINKTDKNLILRLLLNFCIKGHDTGDDKTEDMFKLYQLGINDGAIFYKGKMTNMSLMNITTNALKFGKFEWVATFIKNESSRLYEPQKEFYLSIVDAVVSFYKGNYQECIKQLSNIPSTDITTVELVKRDLKLRAVFEYYLIDSTYASILYADIESYTKFLKRKNILARAKKEPSLNANRLLLRIVKWKEKGGNLNSLLLLKKMLVEMTLSSSYKKWFLNHIQNFEQKLKIGATEKVTP